MKQGLSAFCRPHPDHANPFMTHDCVAQFSEFCWAFGYIRNALAKPVLPTGDGEILRWLKGKSLSMRSGEKSAEQKISPRLHRRFLIGIGGFLLPGFLVCQLQHAP